ncbi:MAG: RNA methyltransferase [Candidatus Yonathbacteria bacterium]|nr:RNA methyltransferase [Candidatus Yonathbacteria bacterium]NTW47664.1 RNA methyltransferase [Candidatus Yonathbacteria bacterium]
MLREEGKDLAIVLHNIRSIHNVGSVFRTADGAGASTVYLSGYTPGPHDRFDRLRKDFQKTALGAENHVQWERVSGLTTLVSRLKKDGWTIVGVEQDSCAVSYRAIPQASKACLIMGNEVRGLSSSAKSLCDILIEIPMRGSKESLNVSVAAGIALYAVADQIFEHS